MEVFGMLTCLKLTGTLGDLMGSVKMACFVWQFFVFPSMFVHRLFDGKSMRLTAIYCTHHLASMLLEAFFMSYFR
jgi:hypothetical protein